MARNKKKTSTMTARGMMLFALPFLGVGLGMNGCSAYTVTKYHRAQRWVEVPAVIQTAELKENRSDDGVTYKAVATYTYEFAGQRYTNDRVSLYPGSDSLGSFQRDAYRELKRHRDSGQPFPCYVNPADPQDAMLYRHLRWEMLLLFAIFAAVFGSAGVWMFMGSWAQKYRPGITPADQVPDDEPWRVRADWATGRIADSDTKVVTPVLSALVIWWILVSLPLVVALPTILDEPHSRWVWLVLLVPAIGALLLLATVYQAVRRLKFGESILELARVPGVVGGPLAGVVRIPAAIDAQDGVRINLQCIRRTHDSDGDTSESALWSSEQLVTSTLGDRQLGETAVPVLVAIPYDAKPSSPPHEEYGVHWTLEVSAAVPGVDYRAEFEVPVFKTADSREGFQLDPELSADYLPQPDVDRLLRQAGILREPLGAEGVRLVFRMFRNPASALTLGAFTAGWTAIVWALLKFDAPIIFPIVFGFFDVLLILVTVDLCFHRSVVEASPRELRVRSGWLGLGIARSYPPDEIERFVAKQHMSSGRRVWNAITVQLKSGTSRRVASAIRSRLVERTVIDQLETALGRRAPQSDRLQMWMDVGAADEGQPLDG